jgi:hypothetical protein
MDPRLILAPPCPAGTVYYSIPAARMILFDPNASTCYPYSQICDSISQRRSDPVMTEKKEKNEKDEKILTKHPEGKKGVNISKEKYDVVRASMIESLQSGQQLTHFEMSRGVEEKLKGSFEGSIPWYVEVVKLDLEARGVIERLPTDPIKYKLIAEGKA